MAKLLSYNGEKLQQENWKSFQAWLTKHKKTLAPETNLGVIYAGQRVVGKVLPSGVIVGGVMKPNPKPMWQFIKQWNQMCVKATGKMRYDTVEDVLKRTSDYPRTKGTSGKANGIYLLYKNMYDCANALGDAKALLLSKKDADKVWKLLSQTYVSNIKGDLAIMEGVKKGFKRLDETKLMISTEIPELMKSSDLTEDSKKEIKQLVVAYKKVYAKHAELGKQISDLEEHLRKQR